MNNKRAELHLHTKLSDDISLIGVKEIVNKAAELGLSAVAFTNLNNVQDFPEIATCAPNTDLKIIYGAELFCMGVSGKQGKITLLVKNQAGIKELYKIISSLHTDGVCNLVDLSVVEENRKNLLIGSCGTDGELFSAIEGNKAQDEIENIAEFYDYFEVYPTTTERQKEINKKIVNLGEASYAPVVATSNAHYLSLDDAVCRDVVQVANGFGIDDNKNLCLRTTDQLLNEFSYLGEDVAKTIVISNPQLLADFIDPVKPIKDGFFGVELENAFEQIETICYDRAYKTYGNPLPKIVSDRLISELELIKSQCFASQYLIAYKMAKHIVDEGHNVGARGTAGSMFVNYLLGISNVNPLVPHYCCPVCHYFEESNLARDGFDLPDKVCPICKKALKADGHHIPYESFMGFNGSKMPDFDINVPSEMRLSEIDYMQSIFGKDKIAMGGTISTLFEYRIQGIVERFEIENDIQFTSEEKAKIIFKLDGVKSGDGMHPGGIMVIPSDMEFEDFTPLKKNWAPIDVTHFDFHTLYNTILKLDALEVAILDFLEMLEKNTGVSLNKINIKDPQIFEFFKNANTIGIPEFENEFMQKLLIKIKPTTFEELIKIFGLAHGTNVWTDNGECLIEKGVPASALPTLRDDIMNDLMSVGIDREIAYKMSDATRRGLFARGKASDETVNLFKEVSKSLGDWYFDFCSKVRYMFPKAHATIYVTYALYCAWFKKYYPQEFYEAYLICYFEDVDNLTEEEKEKYNMIKGMLGKES